jgi:hypothetical protein
MAWSRAGSISPLARVAVALFAVAGGLASCDDTTTPDVGLDAELRVTGGQFFRGDMPAEDGAGPAVKSVALTLAVQPGTSARKCAGVLTSPATAVALSIEGDLGYWIVAAGLPDVTAKGFPTFAAKLDFAQRLPVGTHAFVARAVDAAGHFGPASTSPLVVTPYPTPAGRFVVSLTWDTQADLDLHLTDPSGVEIWKRNINSYEPPPPGSSPEAPGTPHPGGILDFDSEAQCVPDGRHAEHVVYADKPPTGHYVARVDTYELCGASGAHWRVEGFLDGVSIGAVEGSSTEYDTRFSHDRGAGVLALELDVP